MVRIVLTLLVTHLIGGMTEVLARDSVDVHVKVIGLRNNNGSCRLLLFESRRGFPDSPEEAAVVRTARIQKGGIVSFTFKVKPGKYAVVILHDENVNGEIDKTWYGKPTEGYGTSGNSRTGSGPPEFEESAILLDGKNNTLTIAVNYL